VNMSTVEHPSAHNGPPLQEILAKLAEVGVDLDVRKPQGR
jgi:hypothetical protein